ncbi:MAG TPA: hypothetical protein VL574_08705, partial [Stellaceae bacterium]|nr:hypothetical protein [Stellaceae bacterium]
YPLPYYRRNRRVMDYWLGWATPSCRRSLFHCFRGEVMRLFVLALSMFGFMAVTLPLHSADAAPRHSKYWMYKGHKYYHRKMQHGHWHYY